MRRHAGCRRHLSRGNDRGGGRPGRSVRSGCTRGHLTAVQSRPQPVSVVRDLCFVGKDHCAACRGTILSTVVVAQRL